MANEQLRTRRRATPSPSGSGKPMTQAELVEAVNQFIWESTGKRIDLDVDTLARYERGRITWPRTEYRDGLRAVLGVETDAELGFYVKPRGRAAEPGWSAGTPDRDDLARWQREVVSADTLTSSAGTGSDFMDVTRRALLGAAAWSAITLSLPDVREPQSRTRRYGADDVRRVRFATADFSRGDQRYGGGHRRAAIVTYLAEDVLPMLDGRFVNDAARSAAFSVAAELAYVAGWMGFDDGAHSTALRMFNASVRLADEAGDAAMQAHTLRAMAHQALELDRPRVALDLAEASVDRSRYTAACPRERSLLGVVHARALAASGLRGAAAAALLRAEDDLGRASLGSDEPQRVFFFAEASLAHETGRTLAASGDLDGAQTALERSTQLRAKQPFARTHAVTLGYLGEVQAAAGRIEQACSTWSDALDSMAGVRSARARATAVTMRRTLRPLSHANAVASELDARAATYLATA